MKRQRNCLLAFREGRRTASRWFVAAGVKDDWDRFYDFLISLGKKTQQTAAALVQQLVAKFAAADNDRILLALDDSPTQRNGPHVEGAGVHHHPTPGPADGKWLYGHVWVTLSWLATHPHSESRPRQTKIPPTRRSPVRFLCVKR